MAKNITENKTGIIEYIYTHLPSTPEEAYRALTFPAWSKDGCIFGDDALIHSLADFLWYAFSVTYTEPSYTKEDICYIRTDKMPKGLTGDLQDEIPKQAQFCSDKHNNLITLLNEIHLTNFDPEPFM